jgi:hypothetical protein
MDPSASHFGALPCSRIIIKFRVTLAWYRQPCVLCKHLCTVLLCCLHTVLYQYMRCWPSEATFISYAISTVTTSEREATAVPKGAGVLELY